MSFQDPNDDKAETGYLLAPILRAAEEIARWALAEGLLVSYTQSTKSSLDFAAIILRTLQAQR